MLEDSQDSGPVFRFEWTFPLFRVVSSKTKKLKSRVSVNDSDENVPDTLADAIDSDSDAESDVSDNITDLRDRLDSISEPPETVSQEGGEEQLESVTFNGEVFIPLKTEVDVGEDVEFVNTSESDVAVEFDGGEELTVASGDSSATQFATQGVSEFSIVGTDSSEVCGAIIVGNTDQEVTLPCSDDTERVPFSSDEDATIDVNQPDSMSAAAEKKQEQYK